MKDIDFDELDRAVNSLMSGVPKAEPAKQDDINTLSLSPSVKVAEDAASQPRTAAPAAVPVRTSEPPKMEEPSVSSGSPPATIAPPAARRGRFMDMVRPAASEPRNSVPSRAVSRQGSIIQPSAGFSHPATVAGEGTALSGRSEPIESDISSKTDFPDPLAGIDFNSTTEAVKVKATQSGQRSSRPDSMQADAQPAPLASPFLPDAKVEKRPLGRSPEADDSSLVATESAHTPELGAQASDTVDVATDADGSEGDMAVPHQPLPVELGEEVMAIEADTSSVSVEQPEATLDAKPASVQSAAPAVRPAALRPVATSIPQQYKVSSQPSEPVASSGAIYDTATYHQPLSHPAKKQPGWLWVAIIILILLLGAASGAAVYFFGLV